MLAFVVAATALSHVPHYLEPDANCGTPTHEHNVSQAFYLMGSGSVKIKIISPTDPFDILNNEKIFFDVLFAHEYDQSTFNVEVGCGKCGSGFTDLALDGYDKPMYEPFTHGQYYSIFKDEKNKYYDTADLQLCDSNFVIAVNDLGGRDGDHKILRASIVIGKKEQFAVQEIAAFPTYIINNHGKWWNDKGYTLWLAAFGGGLLFCGHVFLFYYHPDNMTTRFSKKMYPQKKTRCLLVLTGWTFFVTFVENLIHNLIYGSIDKPKALVSALAWNFLPNFLYISLVCFFLYLMPRENNSYTQLNNKTPKRCGSAVLGILLVFLGVISIFVVFGAGFYLGPALLIVSGLSFFIF